MGQSDYNKIHFTPVSQTNKRLRITTYPPRITSIHGYISMYVQISEISLESSEDVGVGVILGGVNNNIRAFMLHPLKDQRGLLNEDPQI